MRASESELAEIMNRGGRQQVKKKSTKRSKLESDLEAQLTRMECVEWRQEYKFHSVREWRFDLAWPDLYFAVEVDGLVRDGKGGHQTMSGVTEDCRKHAEALLWGWQVYRCTNAMIKSGEAAETILRLLTRRETQLSRGTSNAL